MTKKKIMAIVDSYVDLDFITLESARKDIDGWIEQYGPDAILEYVDNDYDDGRHLVIKMGRLETDEEYNMRKNTEKHYAKIANERDIKEYQRLRKKFGDSL